MRAPSMTAEEIGKRRDEIVARRGPWRADNLRLAREVFTIGDGAPGREAEVRRAVQTIADLSGSPLKSLRILDLGCGEGGFALELGKQGAEVVAIESRAALLEKATFARDALGLHRVTVVPSDVRKLSPEQHGFFNVVLVLGVLDRLDAPAVFEVAKRAGAVCKGFALVSARLAERARASRESEGVSYGGAPRSVNHEPSFLLTRVSMLALLARSGFTSLLETLHPDLEDGSTCFAAFKGRRVALQTTPQANAVPPPAWAAARGVTRTTTIARLLRRKSR